VRRTVAVFDTDQEDVPKMTARSQSVQQDPTFDQENKYAVYDPVEGSICHHDSGAAISDSRDDAADDVPVVAEQMGISADRLTVVQLTITPTDSSREAGGDDDRHDADADLTTGSITVTRGPHRQNSKLVEYREAEDGAWAVKTPEDDEFWIFLRSGTERDVHQHIRAKWDATYGTPDPFTDQACPTDDL